MSGGVIPDQEATKSGQITGFYLMLFIAPAYGPLALSESTFAHIAIHNKTYKPTYYDGVDVAAGFKTQILMKKTYSTRLPQPFSDCIEDIQHYGSVFTDFFAANSLQYTKSDCLKYFQSLNYSKSFLNRSFF
jgi:hypothetical protein